MVGLYRHDRQHYRSARREMRVRARKHQKLCRYNDSIPRHVRHYAHLLHLNTYRVPHTQEIDVNRAEHRSYCHRLGMLSSSPTYKTRITPRRGPDYPPPPTSFSPRCPEYQHSDLLNIHPRIGTLQQRPSIRKRRRQLVRLPTASG